jgi:hypothetical protein
MEEEYESEINDIRILSEFKGKTFSHFKLTEVRKQLLNCMIEGKIEPSVYWAAELLCSGHFIELWECIFLFYSKYVHVANPKIAVYLEVRLTLFKNILRQGYKENELQLRNDVRIRHLFSEIICILNSAKRKQPYESIKLTREDFEVTRLNEKLKAPTIEYATQVFKPSDPKELFVAVNEFCFHLSKESKNIRCAFFWVEFILEFETLCKKKKDKDKDKETETEETEETETEKEIIHSHSQQQQQQHLKCERRVHIPVEEKYQMDIIWIIWECIEMEALANASPFFQRTVQALLQLFCFHYSTPKAKRRKFLLYFAISFVCENPVVALEAAKEEIIREEEKNKIGIILSNLNLVYKQIKKNEESPGTEYLFHHLKNMNLKKTIEKLEAIDSFDETFVPRSLG